MPNFTLYSSGTYENPVTEIGRGRTIASFHIAQNSNHLTAAEMRRDVLTFLMSPTAVGYWLRKRWIEKCGKIGRTEILRLTADGIRMCRDSLSGNAAVNTSQQIVSNWILRMQQGDSVAHMAREFHSLD